MPAPAGIQVCWDQRLWLRVCWDTGLHRVLVEHKLGSVAWPEDAEPGFAAAPGFPCSLAGPELLAQEPFGVLGAGAWL